MIGVIDKESKREIEEINCENESENTTAGADKCFFETKESKILFCDFNQKTVKALAFFNVAHCTRFNRNHSPLVFLSQSLDHPLYHQLLINF